MKFTRLRLSGFKSFVEPTELVIEPGLTGVVGPNGCGKSNLLEALRWVMGESSYKSMRASGMDDVIFSGTSSRPARNMAEVMVTLDNGARSAPPQFNELESIEIARRIEREAGSAYRINGKDVRARDVQLLFADVSTGARSPALVRQGQIGELINAKPQARRRILEEAAGITGLHTRRHEAELKLKAAEANLQRLQDVVGQLETQLQALKRQARQAAKYKSVSAEIRKLEAASLHLAWTEAEAAATAERRQLDEITRVLAEHTRALSEASRKREEAGEGLPKLREVETARAAAVQRLTIERQSIEDDEARERARRGEIEARLHQIAKDLTRERDTLNDTSAVLSDIEREEASHRELQANEGEARLEAAQALEAAAAALAQVQDTTDQAAARLSDLVARRNGLERGIADQVARLDKAERELAEVTKRQTVLAAGLGGTADRQTLIQSVDAAIVQAGRLEEAANQAEAAARTARDQETEVQAAYEDGRRAAERLETEIRTLSTYLSVVPSDEWPPLVDTLTVRPGYEHALGAALGDDLDVPIDEAAPVHWRKLPPLDDTHPLPAGATPLAEVVDAPRSLTRRLLHTGIVARDQGPRLQAELAPGQRLVSREGDLWRWDGYTAHADAPTASTQRLAARNRLQTLKSEAEAARARSEALKLRHDAARHALDTALAMERQQREAWRAATAAVETARTALASHERQNAERLQQSGALDEAARLLNGQAGEARQKLADLEAERTALADADGLQAELKTLRDAVASERTLYGEARARHDGVEREVRQRAERLSAIARERVQWSERARRSEQQIAELEQRSETARQALQELDRLPQLFEERRKKLMTALSEAETHRNTAADALAAGEQRHRAAEAQLRQAQDALAQSREAHARSEALLEAALKRSADWRQRIAEALACEPEEVAATAGFEPQKMPAPQEIEERLAKLRDERERLGAVNLRADDEAQALQQQLDGIVKERDDLVQAIAKLRGGIQSLNKEGRQRLLDAFESVNQNFTSLFTTLFGGGKAELQLVESEDPLEAGLEILAHPPGKKPQVLSLLSGGEQALTAMALIFAVFLTNPSPICVLDEVDAPLDDHNVERFCNLLDAMLERTDTRFLIITHHALTMARMHRLFGVTMMERGVSQLVSVDLQTAEGLREAS